MAKHKNKYKPNEQGIELEETIVEFTEEEPEEMTEEVTEEVTEIVEPVATHDESNFLERKLKSINNMENKAKAERLAQRLLRKERK